MSLARRLWSSAPARAALGLVLVVAVFAAIAAALGLSPFNKPDTNNEGAGPATSPPIEVAPPPRLLPKVPPTPGILTVSKEWDDGGQYRTITEALAAVKPGEVIRVLDDAKYREHLHLDDARKFRDVTLEAVRGAELRAKSDGYLIRVSGAERVTVRGFKLNGDAGHLSLIALEGHYSGVRLENLEFFSSSIGVEVSGSDHPSTVEPTRIERCTFSVSLAGVYINGKSNSYPPGKPYPRNLLLLENHFNGANHQIEFRGRYDTILVAGNRVTSQCALPSGPIPFTFDTPHPDNKAVVIANNTLVNVALFGFVHGGGNPPEMGGRVRLTGNLLLGSHTWGQVSVMRYYPQVYGGGPLPKTSVTAFGDVSGAAALAKSWALSHNWREPHEGVPPTEKSLEPEFKPTTEDKQNMARFGVSLYPQAIPESAGTLDAKALKGIDRDPKSPNFLRPAADSPLATAGAGRDDPALPRYIGAVPPEGVPAWDWNRTWDAMRNARPPENKK